MITATPIHKAKKRVGRGIAAGGGKTSGRGTKGQNARNGKKHYAGFTGSGLPLAQRLPKFAGFTPLYRSFTLTSDQIEAKTASNPPKELTRSWLIEQGLLPTDLHICDTVKIVRGKKTTTLAITTHDTIKVSKSLQK